MSIIVDFEDGERFTGKLRGVKMTAGSVDIQASEDGWKVVLDSGQSRVTFSINGDKMITEHAVMGDAYSVNTTNKARFKGGLISEKCPRCGRHDPECANVQSCYYEK
jgi:hypothetical protein